MSFAAEAKKVVIRNNCRLLEKARTFLSSRSNSARACLSLALLDEDLLKRVEGGGRVISCPTLSIVIPVGFQARGIFSPPLQICEESRFPLFPGVFHLP